MNDRKIEMIKREYPVGTRLKLISMLDDINPVPSGTCGTVCYVDDEGGIMVDWDNGRSLSIIYGIDKFEVIKEKTKYRDEVNL